MAESEQTQVIQPKKKMGFGKKLIIILAVIVAPLSSHTACHSIKVNSPAVGFYRLTSRCRSLTTE